MTISKFTVLLTLLLTTPVASQIGKDGSTSIIGKDARMDHEEFRLGNQRNDEEAVCVTREDQPTVNTTTTTMGVTGWHSMIYDPSGDARDLCVKQARKKCVRLRDDEMDVCQADLSHAIHECQRVGVQNSSSTASCSWRGSGSCTPGSCIYNIVAYRLFELFENDVRYSTLEESGNWTSWKRDFHNVTSPPRDSIVCEVSADPPSVDDWGCEPAPSSSASTTPTVSLEPIVSGELSSPPSVSSPPSASPSASSPSVAPTAPTVSVSPTSSTVSPSQAPTKAPTKAPSKVPTETPTTKAPTKAPIDKEIVSPPPNPQIASDASTTVDVVLSPSPAPVLPTTAPVVPPPIVSPVLPTTAPIVPLPTLAPVLPTAAPIVPLPTPSPVHPTLAPVPLLTQLPTTKATTVPAQTPTSQHPSSMPSTFPSMSTSQSPTTTTLTPTTSPTELMVDPNPVPDNPLPGYFNYDDSTPYGPSKWDRIDTSTHFLKEFDDDGYGSWQGHFGSKEPLRNRCGGSARHQSPKNMIRTTKCGSHHEIRTKCGRALLSDPTYTQKQILPHKLSIIFSRRPCLNPDDPVCNYGRPPLADYPDYSSSPTPWSDLLNMDLKIPGEHTIEGEVFDAELQLMHAHMKPDPARLSSIGVPIRATVDGHNAEFQTMLTQFQNEYDNHKRACEGGGRNEADTSDSTTNTTVSRRQLNTWVFDPYSYALMPGIYFYRYSGSMTEPPCMALTWWVMSEPMTISHEQLQQMKHILFTNVDEDSCQRTSVHNANQQVTRPIQSLGEDREIEKCDEADFVSDIAKGVGKARRC